MLELFAVALSIPLGVVALLTAYSHFFGGGAVWPEELRPTPEPPGLPALPQSRAQLRQLQSQGLVVLAPNTAPLAYPRPALERGDEFVAELQQPVTRDAGGEVIQRAAQRFLRRGDVLARRVSRISADGAGWNPFVGRTDAAWYIQTDWCLRFHFAPGEELEFVQTLWQLGQEPYAELLGLPRRDSSPAIPAAGDSNYVDPHARQNLLLPVRISWGGDGPFGERVQRRSWELLPQSDLCAAAQEQAGSGAAIAR